MQRDGVDAPAPALTASSRSLRWTPSGQCRRARATPDQPLDERPPASPPELTVPVPAALPVDAPGAVLDAPRVRATAVVLPVTGGAR